MPFEQRFGIVVKGEGAGEAAAIALAKELEEMFCERNPEGEAVSAANAHKAVVRWIGDLLLQRRRRIRAEEASRPGGIE